MAHILNVGESIAEPSAERAVITVPTGKILDHQNKLGWICREINPSMMA